MIPMRRPSFERTNKQFNPQFRQSRIPMVNRTIIPERNYDPQIITQLLLKASTENNFIDLKKFIMENGITTNDMLNDEGQSILHLILLNINLTPRQKLEMIRYFRDNSTLLMSFDKLNQTPLHIACKLQLFDIVEEFIKAGHDINCIDSSYKTPLHYAVIGKSTEAPPKEEKLIIPKNKTKIRIKSDNITNILNSIVQYFNTPNIHKFIENQFNTFLKSKNIFSDKITEILESQNITTKLTEILQNPNIDNTQKKQLIFDLTYESNKQMNEYLNSILIETKKQTKLNQNTENGWGPGNEIVNKIMEYNNLKDLTNELENEYTQKLQTIKNKKTDSDVKLDELKKKIQGIHDNISYIMESIYYTFKFFAGINGKTSVPITPKTPIVYDLSQLLFTDDEIRKNFTYDISDPRYSNTYTSGLYEREIYDFATNQINNINPINDIDNLLNLTLFTKINIDKKFEKEFNNLLTDYERDPDLASPPFETLGFYVQNQVPFMTITPYTVSRKYNLSLNRLIKAFDNIKQKLDLLISNITYPNIAISYINDTVIEIMGSINELVKYMDEYDKNIKYYENIKNILFQKNNNKVIQFFNNKPYEMNIFYDIILSFLNTTIEKMKSERDKTQTELFNKIKIYYDILVDSIKFINETQAIKYINNYYNNFNDIDNIITNQNTELIENLFRNPIENLTQFFTSFDDVLKLIKITDDETEQIDNKTKLLNKFYLQLTNKKNYKFIKLNTDTIALKSNSKIGFLEGNTKLNNLHIDLNKLNFRYGLNGSSIELIDDGDNTKVGEYSIENAFQLSKSESNIPIISILFDKFYQIQKYLLIRYILSKIYDNLPNTVTPPPELKSLIESVRKFNDEIISTLNTNPSDISVLLITIGKLVDKVFNANIENIIKTITNDIVFKLNNIGLATDYKTINITSLNKIDISAFDIDEINRTIYKMFKKQKKLEYYKYVENISKMKPKQQNLYRFIGSNINDNPNDFYMEFDIKLMELLIKNGANVNARDKDGNTPIIIAIIQSNKEAIDYLLNQNISVNTHKSKNRLGYKPLDLCIKSIITSIDNFNNDTNSNAISSLIKEINKELEVITKVNHVMRYNDITIKMLLYLINHIFYSKLNNYSNYKDKELHDMFFKDITTQIENIPLLNNVDNLFVNYHDTIKMSLDDELENIRNKNINHINNLEINTNLDDEYSKTTNLLRKKEIDDTKSKLDLSGLKYSEKSDKLRSLNKDNNDLNKQIIDKLKNINTYLKVTNYPLDIYNNISLEILNIDNDDYRTYTLLWKNLFLNNMNDDTQIIQKVFSIIKNNLNDQNKINKCIDVMKIINYDIENYFQLPNEYSESNYPLTNVMDIIIHITKHTLIVNLYHIILKLLRNELITKIKKTEIQTDNDYNIYIDETIKKIINTKVNNITIKEYLFDIIPEKIVKLSLEIFEYEDDDDKNKSIVDLFNFIEKFLISNTQVQINKDDSKMIKLLNQNVYPYFKNYFEINIKKMKKITDGYYSMLLNFNDKIYILDKVLKKAQKESF